MEKGWGSVRSALDWLTSQSWTVKIDFSYDNPPPGWRSGGGRRWRRCGCGGGGGAAGVAMKMKKKYIHLTTFPEHDLFAPLDTSNTGSTGTKSTNVLSPEIQINVGSIDSDMDLEEVAFTIASRIKEYA